MNIGVGSLVCCEDIHQAAAAAAAAAVTPGATVDLQVPAVVDVASSVATTPTRGP